MATNFPSGLDSYTDKTDNTDTIYASHINNLQDAIEALEAKVGIDSSSVTTSLDYKVNNFFVSGRKLWLYENTAPTGWTIVSVTDKVLAVKGGSGDYNINGGNTSSGTAWCAPHIHQWYINYDSSSDDASYDLNGIANPISGTDNKDSGKYGIGAESGEANALHSDYYTSDISSSSSSYRPPAAVGIIVEKS